MPDQSSETTLSQLKGKTLAGWEEIRQALVFVDSLPEEQHNGARVEAYEYSKDSPLASSIITTGLLVCCMINQRVGWGCRQCPVQCLTKDMQTTLDDF